MILRCGRGSLWQGIPRGLAARETRPRFIKRQPQTSRWQPSKSAFAHPTSRRPNRFPNRRLMVTLSPLRRAGAVIRIKDGADFIVATKIADAVDRQKDCETCASTIDPAFDRSGRGLADNRDVIVRKAGGTDQ